MTPDFKDSLTDVLDKIVIYGGEEGDIEWTLGELEPDASWDIRHVITSHLRKVIADEYL